MLTEKEQRDGLIEVEVWVYVDSEEKHWASEALDTLTERIQEDGAEPGGRLVRVIIKLPAPSFVEVEATLPAESSEATVVVK